MKVINFAETNSVLNQYVAEIRDVQVQSDRMRFRRNIERIGEIMAYEMSKGLTYSEKQVQTPLGIAPVSTFDDDVVIATVFRAGLPLHTGFLNVFDARAMLSFRPTAIIRIRSAVRWMCISSISPLPTFPARRCYWLTRCLLREKAWSLHGRLSLPKAHPLNCRLPV